jgi:hypothetical protein
MNQEPILRLLNLQLKRQPCIVYVGRQARAFLKTGKIFLKSKNAYNFGVINFSQICKTIYTYSGEKSYIQICVKWKVVFSKYQVG